VKAESRIYRLDDLLIDLGSRQVTRDGVDLGITGLTFDLLLALGRAAPNLLSATGIMESVWPAQVVGNETLTQRVKILRRQLGDDPEHPRYIVSRRGYGYRLLSQMTQLSEQRAAASPYPEAEALYLQARTIMRGTHDSRDEALAYLDRALSHDPRFAPALAYRALLLAGSVALSGAPPVLLDTAERSASQALALDARLADAHIALAMIFASANRWTEADAHHLEALAQASADNSVRNMYVLNVLRPTGRLQKACSELMRSYHNAPDDGFTAHELALTHGVLGDDSNAAKFVALAQSLSGIANPHWDLMFVNARIAARLGKFAEAAECAKKALPPILQRAGAAPVIDAFYTEPKTLALEKLLAFTPALERAGVDGRSRAFFLSAIAILGAPDAAFDLAFRWAQKSDGERVVTDWSDLWLPELEAFRRHARFESLASRLGFTEYWRRESHPPPPAQHSTHQN
jgi:DNA-binding winged helix-turn-helix (wHTH) protein